MPHALPRLVWRSSDGAPWVTALTVAGFMAAGVFAGAGLPHVSLMHPFYAIGVVTPTCGLTRSVVAIVSGEFALAWRFNPAGFVAVASGAGVAARWVTGRLTGRWLAVVVADWRIPAALAATAVVLLWINQQAHATFVIEARL